MYKNIFTCYMPIILRFLPADPTPYNHSGLHTLSHRIYYYYMNPVDCLTRSEWLLYCMLDTKQRLWRSITPHNGTENVLRFPLRVLWAISLGHCLWERLGDYGDFLDSAALGPALARPARPTLATRTSTTQPKTFGMESRLNARQA